MIYENAILSGSIKVSGSLDLNGQALEPVTSPTVSLISPTNILETANSDTFTITGTNFDSQATAVLIGNNGIVYSPDTSTRTSSTSITLYYTGSTRITSDNEPYDVKVTNGSGFTGTLNNAVTVDATPIWQTEANLGQILAGRYLTASIYTTANDPESLPVTYSLDSGTVPSGLTYLTSSGEITGSSIVPLDSSNYNQSGIVSNFTVTATDNTGQSNTRTFSITKKWNDGTTQSTAAQYGSEVVNILGGNFVAGRYWLTGIASAGLAAQQVYVDTNGWMLFYRHAGTGGTFNGTYEIQGDSLGEAAVGTPVSPTMGLTDTGASTTAGSRGVGRFSTEFTRALGGNNASNNVIWMTCGNNTAYITDAQWWSTVATGDGYGQTSLSFGATYAGRRTYTNFTGDSSRPMSTYPGAITTIPWYEGTNQSGGYDGTWHVATTIYIRQY